MSSSDVDKTTKEGKEPKEPKTPSAQFGRTDFLCIWCCSADWSRFQTYSPMPPHGFLASSPQANPYMWGVQEERELKRRRRKQSNRESARRSRLRKQAECDDLAQRAESLKE